MASRRLSSTKARRIPHVALPAGGRVNRKTGLLPTLLKTKKTFQILPKTSPVPNRKAFNLQPTSKYSSSNIMRCTSYHLCHIFCNNFHSCNWIKFFLFQRKTSFIIAMFMTKWLWCWCCVIYIACCFLHMIHICYSSCLKRRKENESVGNTKKNVYILIYAHFGWNLFTFIY